MSLNIHEIMDAQIERSTQGAVKAALTPFGKPCRYHLVAIPTLEVLNTFPGYTVDATRELANANCCIRTSDVHYFGLYTDAELAAMRQRKAERGQS